jgi:uncharacterized membrane protein
MTHTYAPFRNLEGISSRAESTPIPNVGTPERIGSAILGLASFACGVKCRGWLGGILTLVGAYMIHRGVTGRCEGYRRLGIDTAGNSDGRGVPQDVGVKVDKSVEVRRSPMELYHFWHQLTNLPEIMPHVISVTLQDSRSHWVVAGPAGKQVEWDAEFINEKPGELISWQSLPGSQVQSAGSVRFDPIGDGQATRVRVVLEYLPPAGKAGAFVARLLGSSPEQQLETDLQRFKERMESGWSSGA